MRATRVVRPTLFLASLAAFAVCVAQDQKPHTYVPPAGYIPNDETALAVARAVLTPVYGKKVLADEEPFKATLTKGTWLVRGTLGGGKAEDRGGVAAVWISKRTGAILRMTHGK